MRRNLIMATAVATFALLVQVLFCGLGIDVEDCCFHLFMAQNAYDAQGFTLMTCPLSYYILGWWMSLAPVPRMMWWGYFGGAILYGLITFVSTLIYCEVFKDRRKSDYIVLLAVFIASTVWYSRNLICYYTFPIFLSLVFIYTWIKSGFSDYTSRAWLVLTGFIGVVVFFSRFTFVTVLALPPMLWLYRMVVERGKNLTIIWRALRWYAFGVILGLAILVPLFLCWKHQFDVFAQVSEMDIGNLYYRLNALVRPILELLMHRIPESIGYVFVASCFVLACRRCCDRFMGIALPVLMCLAAVLLLVHSNLNQHDVVYGYSGNGVSWRYIYVITPVELVFCAFCLLGLYDRHVAFGEVVGSWRQLIAIILLFSLLVPLGSDVYHLKIGYMIPLLSAFVGGALFRCDKGWSIKGLFFSFLIFNLLSRMMYGMLNPVPVNCDTESRVPCLKWMYTSRKRADVLDKTFAYLSRMLRNEKEILLISHKHFAPLYICDVQNWNCTVCRGGDSFLARYQANREKKELPKYIVLDNEFLNGDKRRDSLLSGYHCLFDSDKLPNGDSQNFHYSLWMQQSQACDKSNSSTK